jgi:hypothetical protein
LPPPANNPANNIQGKDLALIKLNIQNKEDELPNLNYI